MLEKYLELFENPYEEPQEIVIMGTFSKTNAASAIATGSAVITGNKRKIDQGNYAKRTTSVEQRKKIVKCSHDIRSMFKKTKRSTCHKYR